MNIFEVTNSGVTTWKMYQTICSINIYKLPTMPSFYFNAWETATNKTDQKGQKMNTGFACQKHRFNLWNYVVPNQE